MWAVFGTVEVLVALSLLFGFLRRWGGYVRNHALITRVPVLAAFWLLYWNRNLDRLWVLDKR